MSLISGNESKIFAKGVIGNVRKAQEDSHGFKLATPNGDLFVVCDGMGGHVGGAMASKIAVDSIVSYMEADKYPSPIEALDGALQFANMQILGYAASHPEYKGMGTTACIVLIQGDDVWIAHVGDSRIYLYLEKENQLHRITKDHSYVQTLVDAGEITDEEAEHHPNKNRIMKALGIKPEMQPTFNYENKPIHPKNGDVFLICSDGLSGMIPDRTIARVMGEKMTLQEKGDKLIELAMVGETVVPGGQDNCTLELIEVDNSNWKTSEFKSYSPKNIVQPENTVQKVSVEAPPQKQEIRKDPPSGKKSVRIAVSAVVVLLALGAAFWWFTKDKQECNCEKLQNDYHSDSLKLNSATKKYNTLTSQVLKTSYEDTLNDLKKKLKDDSIAYSKCITTRKENTEKNNNK